MSQLEHSRGSVRQPERNSLEYCNEFVDWDDMIE